MSSDFNLSSTELNAVGIVSCCLSNSKGVLCTAATEDNVYRTSDGGATWTQASSSEVMIFGTSTKVQILSPIILGDYVVARTTATHTNTFVVSTDAGNTWTSKSFTNCYKPLFQTDEYSISASQTNYLTKIGKTLYSSTQIGATNQFNKYNNSLKVTDFGVTVLSNHSINRYTITYCLDVTASPPSIETFALDTGFVIVSTGICSDYFLVVAYDFTQNVMQVYKAPLQTATEWEAVGDTFSDLTWTDVNAVNTYINDSNTDHFCITCAKKEIYYSYDGGSTIQVSETTQQCRISSTEQRCTNPLIGYDDVLMYMSGNTANQDQAGLISFDCGKTWSTTLANTVGVYSHALDPSSLQCLLGSAFENNMYYKTLQSLQLTLDDSITYSPSSVDTPHTFDVSSTSSGQAITVTSSASSVVSIPNSSVFQMYAVDVGESDITAFQAGNSVYYPASVTKTQVVSAPSQESQTITFDSFGTPFVYSTDLRVSLVATSTSGLPVTFQAFDAADTDVISELALITESEELSFLSAGTFYITAWQEGSENYFPAEAVTRSLTVQRAPQTITSFETLSSPYTYSFHATVPLQATASSGLPVTFLSSNPDVAFIVENGDDEESSPTSSFVMRLPGTSLLSAMQNGNSCYEAATPVSRPLTIVSEAICFAGSVRIAVQNEMNPYTLSHVPISELQVGQKVFTKENKFIPIAKIGKMKFFPGRLFHQRLFYHKKHRGFVVTGNHGVLDETATWEELEMQQKKFGYSNSLGGVPLVMAAVSSQMQEWVHNDHFGMDKRTMMVYHLVLESSDRDAQFGICGEEEVWSESCSMAVYEKFLKAWG